MIIYFQNRLCKVLFCKLLFVLYKKSSIFEPLKGNRSKIRGVPNSACPIQDYSSYFDFFLTLKRLSNFFFRKKNI